MNEHPSGGTLLMIIHTTAQLADPNEKTHSVSHLSFDGQLESFGILIDRLNTVPQYDSNEPELTTAGLKAYYLFLDSLNKDVADAYAALVIARAARNEALYAPVTGIIDTVKAIKDYVIIVFGYQSKEIKELRRFKFTKPY